MKIILLKHGDKYTAVIQDYYTSWLDNYPVNTKSSDAAIDAFRQSFGPDVTPKAICARQVSRAVVGSSSFKLPSCELYSAHSSNEWDCR